jgi:hypothetical protein
MRSSAPGKMARGTGKAGLGKLAKGIDGSEFVIDRVITQ